MSLTRTERLARCLVTVVAIAAPDAAVSDGREVNWCETRYEHIDIGLNAIWIQRRAPVSG